MGMCAQTTQVLSGQQINRAGLSVGIRESRAYLFCIFSFVQCTLRYFVQFVCFFNYQRPNTHIMNNGTTFPVQQKFSALGTKLYCDQRSFWPMGQPFLSAHFLRSTALLGSESQAVCHIHFLVQIFILASPEFSAMATASTWHCRHCGCCAWLSLWNYLHIFNCLCSHSVCWCKHFSDILIAKQGTSVTSLANRKILKVQGGVGCDVGRLGRIPFLAAHSVLWCAKKFSNISEQQILIFYEMASRQTRDTWVSVIAKHCGCRAGCPVSAHQIPTCRRKKY